MQSLKRFLEVMEKVCLIVSVLAVGVMITINTVQIFFRYVLNMAFVWVFPVTMLLFIWMTFLGAFVVYRRKKDIVVRFLVNMIPSGGQNILLLITNILIMLLLIWILSEVTTIFQRQTSIMQIIPLPRYTQAVPLFIGVAGIFLEYLVETVELSKRIFTRTERRRY